jgi:Cathepsin propeptide inhibitor domain (I29)
MKITISAVLALLLVERAVGFLPPNLLQQQRQQLPATLGMAETDVGADVSVPYDAAARLAYDQWRSQYDKGAFDAKRYESFKRNYETITVANVIAKKRAREQQTGTVSLSLLSLNEFGDMTEEEYANMMNTSVGKEQGSASASTAAPTTTSDVLSQAMEAAELQTAASNALGEAADALALEEQVSRLQTMPLRRVFFSTSGRISDERCHTTTFAPQIFTETYGSLGS